jgi:hypothetical protein
MNQIELEPIIHYNLVKLNQFKQYLSKLNKHIIQSIITELKQNINQLEYTLNNTLSNDIYYNLYQYHIYNSKQSLLYINKCLKN